MPAYNVLYIIEHEFNEANNYSNSKTDNRLVVIFDESEDTYYCYGTRERLNETKKYTKSYTQYKEYKASYPYDKITTLANWISLLNNNFASRYTIEMHQVDIDEDENSSLTFNTIYSKLSRYNELFAYDKISETEGAFIEKLDMLSSIINF